MRAVRDGARLATLLRGPFGLPCGARIWRESARIRCAQTIADSDPPASALLSPAEGIGSRAPSRAAGSAVRLILRNEINEVAERHLKSSMAPLLLRLSPTPKKLSNLFRWTNNKLDTHHALQRFLGTNIRRSQLHDVSPRLGIFSDFGHLATEVGISWQSISWSRMRLLTPPNLQCPWAHTCLLA